MQRENIAAHTAHGESYPAFVNISKLEDGSYSIIVRETGEDGVEGSKSEIVMSEAEFANFIEVTNDHLAELGE